MIYLNTAALVPGNPHISWTSVISSARDVARARIRCRLLTGTYILQYNRSRFNQSEQDPICQLCHTGNEDRIHFICICPVLHTTRVKFSNELAEIVGPKTWEVLTQTPDTLTHYILDTNSAVDSSLVPQHQMILWDMHARMLCFYLHINRTLILSYSSSTKRSNQCRKAAPMLQAETTTN